jgi:hypothetical protein
VTLEQSIIDARSEVERAFGKLHIARNNTGVPMHGSIAQASPIRSRWTAKARNSPFTIALSPPLSAQSCRFGPA